MQHAPDSERTGPTGGIIHTLELRAERIVEIDLADIVIRREQRHDHADALQCEREILL